MEGMTTVFGPESFTLVPNRERVFGWLGCDRDIPCRRAFERAWPLAAAALEECLYPQAATARGDDGALTVFLTLGPRPEARMTALFGSEAYVVGGLMNTMCDELLFQMDQQAASLISAMLRSKRAYAGSRLEPGINLTAEAQREKLAPIQKALPFARISETGILYPSKSMMYVVTVSDQPCRLEALHDCSACGQKNCLYRQSRPAVPEHGAR